MQLQCYAIDEYFNEKKLGLGNAVTCAVAE